MSTKKRQDIRIEKEADALKKNLEKRKKQAADLKKIKNSKDSQQS